VRLDLTQRIGRDYDQATIFDLLRQVEQQVNDLADGRISAIDGAMTAAPSSGNWVKGDLVRDSSPTLTNGKLRLGFLCTASGAPGTWKDLWARVASTQPLRTVYTSGSGTHTPTAGCTRMEVEIVAAGGGGAASGTTPGSAAAGGNTTFGSLTANGGGAGGNLLLVQQAAPRPAVTST
jgi:hypothetical protein